MLILRSDFQPLFIIGQARCRMEETTRLNPGPPDMKQPHSHLCYLTRKKEQFFTSLTEQSLHWSSLVKSLSLSEAEVEKANGETGRPKIEDI